MKYIECPQMYVPSQETTIFLAGGISSCQNWQPIMADLLKDTNLTILNPRRKFFDTTIPGMEEEQIVWEFNHLNMSTLIMFWFCAETLCPITLFEYGKWIEKGIPLFVGHHPDYKRKNDLRIQTALVRKEQKIHDSLEKVAEEIKRWC